MKQLNQRVNAVYECTLQLPLAEYMYVKNLGSSSCNAEVKYICGKRLRVLHHLAGTLDRRSHETLSKCTVD